MEAYDEALLDSVGAILGLLPSEVIQSSRFINAPSLAPRVVLAFFSDGGFVYYNELVTEGLVSLKLTQNDRVYGIGTLAPDKLSDLGIKPWITLVDSISLRTHRFWWISSWV